MIENLLDKFTKHFKRILIQAQTIAYQEQSPAIDPVHLLEAMLQQKGCIGVEIMNKQNITVQNTTFRAPERLHLFTENRPLDFWNLPQPSNVSQKIIEQAVKTSFEYHHKYIGSEHLLAAIVKVPDPKIKTLFEERNVNSSALYENIETVLRSSARFNALHPESNDTRQAEHADEGAPSVLDMFTTDLTSDEVQKNIDPVIGREKEIDRLIQILSRRTKNNPIVLGDPGVGKTAIIEGLAKKIVQGDVPDVLSDKHILTLDLSAVVAGTMYRGEFESRLKQIIDEVKNDDSIILFIDEIHNIIGTGSSAGSLDAANILKPALARGQLRCIGATTHEEYKKFIESDKALERRFQVIMIDEATASETFEILKGIKENYEKYHAVTITEDALDAAVRFSQRYLPDKKLPDKAIDLIDEAASHIKVSKKFSPTTKRIKELEASLRTIQDTKRSLILDENYGQALNIKDQEDIVLQELESLKKLRDKNGEVRIGTISSEDIAHVVSQATGIPITDIVATEKKRLSNLGPYLKQFVFGQDEAIDELAQTIRRSRAGLSDPRKPLGSFIFLGPSGVGKTETARLISRFLFNREDALIRIDMSEFAERFNVSKLIGAPAGYVGYKEGTQLSDAVKKRPFSVVLFDEIEKAHPDVFNLLLPVLEDGYLTDATGNRVNFRNTIIIMTSNVGLREFTSHARLGFSLEDDEAVSKSERMKELATKSLRDQFRPEFLNRIDKVVIFNSLNAKVARQIIKRELDELKARVHEKDLTLSIQPAVISNLLALFKADEGARSLKRAVQDKIVNPIANKLLNGTIHEKQKTISVSVDKNGIIIK